MEFNPIVILSAFLAVLQLVLTMLPGVWYTRRGTVNTTMRRALSSIAFNLLLPCVVFINVAGNVSASTIGDYWPFAFNTTVSMAMGMALGWLINEVTGTPKHLRYHVIAAAGFANLNSLPLMITTAVCNQKDMPFYQALGSRCTTVGFGYVAISSAVNQIVGYPIAKCLLKPRPPPRSVATFIRQASKLVAQTSSTSLKRLASLSSFSPRTSAASAAPPHRASFSRRGAAAAGAATPAASAALPAASEEAGEPAPLGRPRRSITAPHSLSLSRQPRPAGLPTTWAEFKRQMSLALAEAQELDGEGYDAPAEDGAATSPARSSRGSAAAALAAEAVAEVEAERAAAERAAAAASAANCGAIDADTTAAGAANGSRDGAPNGSIAAMPPLGSRAGRGAPATVLEVVDEDDEDDDEGGKRSRCLAWAAVPWGFVRDNVVQPPTITSMLSIGIGCAAPLKNLFFPIPSAALGFISGAAETLQEAYVFVASFILGSVMARGPGQGTRSVGVHACAAVCFVRFVVLPLAGAVIVVSSVKAGLYAPPDPVFAFLLMLQYCVPSANQVQNMASMWGNHEREVGALIFWEYVVALVCIPAWMVCFVWLIDRFELYPTA